MTTKGIVEKFMAVISEAHNPVATDIQKTIAIIEALGEINKTLNHLVSAIENLDQGFKAGRLIRR